MLSQNKVPDAVVAPNEMKLRRKYRVKKPGSKGVSKKNNSGGCGRRAKATAKGNTVTSRTSPEQYGQYRAWAEKNHVEIKG